MYGSNAINGIAGGTLAATGLTAGSWVLLVIGAVFILVGIYAVFKVHSKVKP